MGKGSGLGVMVLREVLNGAEPQMAHDGRAEMTHLS